MGYRQPFTAMLAIWSLLLVVEALAQGVPAPHLGPRHHSKMLSC